MKRFISLLIIISLCTCGCISNGNSENLPPEIDSFSPSQCYVRIAPYEIIPFSIEPYDADGDDIEIEWYVDDELVSYGDCFDYSTDSEGVRDIKVIVDDGKDNSFIIWQVESSISLESMMDHIEEMRNLSFNSEVPLIEMTREEIEEELFLDTDEQRSLNEINQEIFEAFGVWDDTKDLQDEIVSLYEGAIGGYYDYEEKYFVVVNDELPCAAFKEKTMAHELIHVLQDQAYGIQEMFDTASDDDMLYALQALMEGDALYFENQYIGSMGPDKINDLFTYMVSIDIPDVNSFLYDVVLAPYTNGEAFIRYIIENKGIDYLDFVYASPPQSTEQILHPEKYFADDAPMSVDISTPEGGWIAQDENVLGEMMLNIILEEETDQNSAMLASEGWGGDKYGYYTKDSEYILLYKIMWDTSKDCDEFFSLYCDIITSRDDSELIESSSTSNIWNSDSSYIKLSRDTSSILLQVTSSLENIQ